MRVGLRELLNETIAHGDLSQNANREAGADRIAALGRSDPLGAALWRVLGQGRVSDIKEVRDRLADRLGGRGIRPALLRPLALLTLEEWLGSPCPTCGGREHATTADGVRVTCWECGGSGRGGHSAESRMKRLGIGRREYAGLSQVFSAAAMILTIADKEVGIQIGAQLGRGRRVRGDGSVLC